MFQPTKGQPFTCVFSFFLSFHSNRRIESEERFVEIAAIWEETMKISDIPVEVKDVGLCFGCLSNSWFLGYPATLIYRIIESEVGDICDEGRCVCLHVSYHLHVWFTRNKKITGKSAEDHGMNSTLIYAKGAQVPTQTDMFCCLLIQRSTSENNRR